MMALLLYARAAPSLPAALDLAIFSLSRTSMPSSSLKGISNLARSTRKGRACRGRAGPDVCPPLCHTMERKEVGDDGPYL